jgi:hypothetical protein
MKSKNGILGNYYIQEELAPEMVLFSEFEMLLNGIPLPQLTIAQGFFCARIYANN